MPRFVLDAICLVPAAQGGRSVELVCGPLTGAEVEAGDASP